MTPPHQQFAFAACQPGSEAALKQEVARELAHLRFAFSRPGFVTFRARDDAASSRATPPARDETALAPLERGLDCAFARTSGRSLGRVRGADDAQRAHALWTAIAEDSASRDPAAFRHLHVWTRERALPGDTGYDPAADAALRSLGERILEHRPRGEAMAVNEIAKPGDRILDCVVVEPDEWWLGAHRAASPPSRWPGGAPPAAAPSGMVSRAYLKLVEALLWSELPIRAGDRCVEIGSGPGGSAQALLERGCIVAGVDPAEMDAAVLANPRFTHVRARAKDAPRDVYAGCRWLTIDVNAAPKYTLDTAAAIASESPGIRGLVLTLKLTDAALAARLPAFAARIRSWGYDRVRARQLAFNRREICVVATRA